MTQLQTSASLRDETLLDEPRYPRAVSPRSQRGTAPAGAQPLHFTPFTILFTRVFFRTLFSSLKRYLRRRYMLASALLHSACLLACSERRVSSSPGMQGHRSLSALPGRKILPFICFEVHLHFATRVVMLSLIFTCMFLCAFAGLPGHGPWGMERWTINSIGRYLISCAMGSLISLGKVSFSLAAFASCVRPVISTISTCFNGHVWPRLNSRRASCKWRLDFEQRQKHPLILQKPNL